MRVTYGRQIALKKFLDGISIETFLPMTEKVQRKGKSVHSKRVPAISNLIFVHTQKKLLDELKHTRAEAEPLRYMTRPVHLSPTSDPFNEIIVVPDKQMLDFIRVASAPDDERTFLTADDLKAHAGASVIIASGPFKGVEGVIKRIHGNRRVVIELAGIGGVCINFIPSKYLIKKDNNADKG